MFGGFWLTFGATIVPGFGAYGTYSPATAAAQGLDEPQFYATFSFFLVAMTILCAIFTVASIRTNVVFFAILLLLVPTCKCHLPGTSHKWDTAADQAHIVSCLAASFFAVSQGSMETALRFQYVGAGLLLAVSFLGWYIFLALILLAVEFPFSLPVGDLSTVVKKGKCSAVEEEDMGRV